MSYYDTYSGKVQEYVFKISNTYSGAIYGGFINPKSGEGRGIFGQVDHNYGISGKDWEKERSNVLMYGVHFYATGQEGSVLTAAELLLIRRLGLCMHFSEVCMRNPGK